MPVGGAPVATVIAGVLGGSDASGSLGAYWAATFPTLSDQPYHDPHGGSLAYRTGEASGGACAETPADAAQNAAYCAVDESISYDIDWLSALYASDGRVGPITVLAHEWGHHIQHLAGEPDMPMAAELQADCYAGMYLRALADGGLIDATDMLVSLAVIGSLGDDPRVTGGWNDVAVHGTPDQRRQAEAAGYATGVRDHCVAEPPPGDP